MSIPHIIGWGHTPFGKLDAIDAEDLFRDAALQAIASAGLDAGRAHAVLDSDEFTEEVRQAEAFWQQAGIRSVPAVVVNDRHLIQGGQPPEVFEQALRQIAAEAAAGADRA